MRILEDADRSTFASLCREVAFDCQKEVFTSLYIYVFGEPLLSNRPSSASRGLATTRRSKNPREAYFKALRETPKRWHFLLMSLHKKDYANEKFRALMNRWRFPCAIAAGTALSGHQRSVLNKAHAAFEHAPLLCVAARFSKWGAVKTLLVDYHADPTVTDARGMNILSQAAWSGKFQIVRFIFQQCNNEELKVMVTAKGIPHMTSACGGKGPYNAYTWSRRKAAYCVNDVHRKTGLQFKKIANYIQQRAEEVFKDDEVMFEHGNKGVPSDGGGCGVATEKESTFIFHAMAVHDLRNSYEELISILEKEGREVPALVTSAIADNDRLLKRAAQIEECRTLAADYTS